MAFESELEAELEDEFEAELEDESEGELEDEMEGELEDEAAEHFAPLAHMAASKILPVVAKAAKLSKTLSKAGQVAKLANHNGWSRVVLQ